MSDEDIVSRIINRDETSIQDLINSYGKLIFGVIEKTLIYGHYRDEVDELFNEVIFKLWNNIKYFDVRRKLSSYIISVAKFTAIDYVRKYGKETLNLEIKEEILDLVGSEDKYNILNEKEEFLNLIEPLKVIDKNIFLRRYYFSEDIIEIAKALNVTSDYINNRLSRGRKKLRERLGGDFIG